MLRSPRYARSSIQSNMASFTLYGSRGSTCTDRVRLTLAEGGFTNYELVFLNLPKGEQRVSNFKLKKTRLEDTNIYLSLKSIRNGTLGAKCRRSPFPTDSLSTKVAPFANTSRRSMPSHWYLMTPRWKPRGFLSKPRP